MADVDFFFDFISPYTYVARSQLGGIASRTGTRSRVSAINAAIPGKEIRPARNASTATSSAAFSVQVDDPPR